MLNSLFFALVLAYHNKDRDSKAIPSIFCMNGKSFSVEYDNLDKLSM